MPVDLFLKSQIALLFVADGLAAGRLNRHPESRRRNHRAERYLKRIHILLLYISPFSTGATTQTVETCPSFPRMTTKQQSSPLQ